MKFECSINQIPDNWDNRIRDNGDLTQTTFWARVISKIDKAVPIFLEMYDDEQNIIGKVLLFHKFPWDRDRQKLKSDFKSRILRKGWLECCGLPIIYTSDKDKEELFYSEVINWAGKYAKDNKLMYINFLKIFGTANDDERLKELFAIKGYKPEVWATYIVDISIQEEELWEKISSASRKAIKKAKREGITIEKITTFEDYKEKFLKNYYHFSAKEFDENNDSLKIPWDEDVEGYYHYYVASIGEMIIGTLGMYVIHGVATEIMSSISPYSIKNKLPAQDLLHWEMFLDAKKMGCSIFDLAGVNPNPLTDKEAGIRRFKKKWNGEYIEYYNCSKISYWFRQAYDIYYKIKRGN